VNGLSPHASGEGGRGDGIAALVGNPPSYIYHPHFLPTPSQRGWQNPQISGEKAREGPDHFTSSGFILCEKPQKPRGKRQEKSGKSRQKVKLNTSTNIRVWTETLKSTRPLRISREREGRIKGEVNARTQEGVASATSVSILFFLRGETDSK